MAIFAANIIVGNVVIKKTEDISANRIGQGSFKAFSEKTHNLPVPKVRDTDDTLIQYKESAFLSDMLSSSKD